MWPCLRATMFCGTAKAPEVYRRTISFLTPVKMGCMTVAAEHALHRISSWNQIVARGILFMLLETPEINSKRELYMLCVARVKRGQAGQIWSKSHHSRAPGVGSLGWKRCTHTACIRRSENVSASARAYTDSIAEREKMQGKESKWPEEKHDVGERTKGGNWRHEKTQKFSWAEYRDSSFGLDCWSLSTAWFSDIFFSLLLSQSLIAICY